MYFFMKEGRQPGYSLFRRTAAHKSYILTNGPILGRIPRPYHPSHKGKASSLIKAFLKGLRLRLLRLGPLGKIEMHYVQPTGAHGGPPLRLSSWFS